MLTSRLAQASDDSDEKAYRECLADFVVTEDRQGEGLFLMHSITRNISAATWRRVRSRVGLIDIAQERERAKEWAQRLAIRTPTVAQLVSNLSGGNKPKVSLGKWLVANPELLIIDEPTIGLDIRTKYEVHNLIVRLANDGMSIIVISSDLVEIVRLVDRILVFRDGAVVGEHENTKSYDGMSRLVMSDILRGDATATAPPPVAASPNPLPVVTSEHKT